MKRLLLLLVLLLFTSSSYALELTFNTEQPSIGSDDIYSLTGALLDRNNVGTATADGGANDGTTYVSYDRPSQGQTFTTNSTHPAYSLNAITVRHCQYSGNTDSTWTRFVTGDNIILRITDPQLSGTDSFVIASEAYTITGSEPGIFSVNSVTNSSDGTGTWLTFTLASPVVLDPAKIYAFDLSLPGSSFFELHGINNTAPDGNPYSGGTAYTSGNNSNADNNMTVVSGDRVFILSFTESEPIDHSIIDKFDSYEDTSALAEFWQTEGAISSSISSDGFDDSSSMLLAFDNTGATDNAGVTLSFDTVRNFTTDNSKSLNLVLKNNTSTTSGMYIRLADDGWGVNYAEAAYSQELNTTGWQKCSIALDSFTEQNPSLNLTRIKTITIGFTADSGSVNIDNISLAPQSLILEADFSGDNSSDIADLEELADQWLSAGSTADIDHNQRVDLADMAYLAKEWLSTGSLFPVDDTLGGISSVPFTQVSFNDDFWLPRLEVNRTVTVPYIFNKLEETGRIENFAIAGGLSTATPQYSFPFDDTDIYKTLEGASYSLMVSPDPELDAYLDELIVLIAASQEDDGYLYTIRTNGMDIWSGSERWSSLVGSHELYDAGHLFEAAIAHYQATGKTSLLNVAIKFADLLVDTFHEGGIEIPPGHEVVETALARLAEVTGDMRYLDLARYYLDIRGTVTNDYSPWGEYNQDHLPVLQQTEAVGHVVRALYLYMGMADVAQRCSDLEYHDELMTVLEKIWHSVNDTKAYITGGLGAQHGGESFGSPYYLPNDGYCETCAQIANVMWNQRMFLYFRDGKYIDAMERSLYNSVISGVSLDGDKFFYPNPLESHGGYERSSWFSCNCCIGNIARTIPSVPGYVYCKGDHEIYVNMYVASTSNIELADTSVSITQQGQYPWQGSMSLQIDPVESKKFTVYLRIPGWARNQPVPGDLYQYKHQASEPVQIMVNGNAVPVITHKGYVAITRDWSAGDTISLELPMSVRQVLSHPSIAEDVDHVSLERGPIVYCLEWPDYPDNRFSHLYVPDDVQFTVDYSQNMLSMANITNQGNIIHAMVKGLYENIDGDIDQQDELLTAIPYYAWAHRGTGPMAVWLADVPSAAVPVSTPTPSELIGHWTLDENTGVTASDSSGFANNGTLANGLTFDDNSVSGVIGDALAFDGTDDYIDLAGDYDDFAKGCTISVWVYPTAVKNWARFVDFGNGPTSDNIWFGRLDGSNTLIFESWAGGGSAGRVVADSVIDLDQWQMFTVTCDSQGNARLFKNGQFIVAGTTSPLTNVVRNNCYIGRSNWGGDAYYQGSVDDLRVYNYPLSDTDIADIYNEAQ